jgi:hypothetical protein
MLLIGLLLSCCSTSDDDSDLPYEPDLPSDDQLPFEADSAPPEPEESPDVEEEINDAEVGATPTSSPSPTPARINRSLAEVTGTYEIIVAIGMAVYLATFLYGRRSVQSKIEKLAETLLASLRRHFAVCNGNFEMRNYHEYHRLITGRTGYQVGIITQKFQRACDPLGILLSILRGDSDKLIIEFLLKPVHQFCGVLHVSKEKPYFADDLKLKSYGMKQKYSVWTDIPDQRDIFVNPIREFIEEHPGVVELIELSDVNRFTTRSENRYVAHFELKVVGQIDRFISDSLVDSIVKIADSFVVLTVPPEVHARNEKAREQLLKEKQGKKEEEKKLTPEELEKLERKREKKEQKRLTPKIKLVRQ